MSRNEEITATVTRENFRFGDDYPYTLILDASVHPKDNGPRRYAAVKVRLESEEDSVEPDLTYRFYGQWTDYTNRRTGETTKQFIASTFILTRPHGKAGVIRYLTDAPGIGRVLAQRLWEQFQGDAVKILRTDPEYAAKMVRGLRPEVAMDASEFLCQEELLEDCQMDLMDLLEGRGFPKSVLKTAVKEFGNLAAVVIRRNPYLLMRFRGCGFMRAHAMYLDLGYNPRRIKCQALCAWHAISSQSNGSTWQLAGVAEAALRKSIGGASVQFQKALALAKRGGILCATRTDGGTGPIDFNGRTEWLADTRKARNESSLACYVLETVLETEDEYGPEHSVPGKGDREGDAESAPF